MLTTKGKGIRIKVKDIRLVGRIAQGVKLINLKEGDQIASIARLVDEEAIEKVAGEVKKPGAVDLFDS